MPPLLAFVAGGALQGFGKGLGDEGKRRAESATRMEEIREGARLRHEYQMQHLDAEGEIRRDVAEIGAAATRDTAETRAQAMRDSDATRAGIAADKIEATTEEADTKRLEKRFELLATEIDPDTGEEVFNKDLYQGLRAGHRKFGQMPSLQQVRMWVESSAVTSRRKWPSETSYSWEQITERVRVRKPELGPEELREAVIYARDKLAAQGINVPEGEPPAPKPMAGKQGGGAAPPLKTSGPDPLPSGMKPYGSFIEPGEDPGDHQWLIRAIRERNRLEQGGDAR